MSRVLEINQICLLSQAGVFVLGLGDAPRVLREGACRLPEINNRKSVY